MDLDDLDLLADIPYSTSNPFKVVSEAEAPEVYDELAEWTVDNIYSDLAELVVEVRECNQRSLESPLDRPENSFPNIVLDPETDETVKLTPISPYPWPENHQPAWLPRSLTSASLNSTSIAEVSYSRPNAEQLKLFNGIIGLLGLLAGHRFAPIIRQPGNDIVTQSQTSKMLRYGSSGFMGGHDIISMGLADTGVYYNEEDPSSSLAVLGVHVVRNPDNLFQQDKEFQDRSFKETPSYDTESPDLVLADLKQPKPVGYGVFGKLNKAGIFLPMHERRTGQKKRAEAEATEKYAEVLPDPRPDRLECMVGEGVSFREALHLWNLTPFSYRVNNEAHFLNVRNTIQDDPAAVHETKLAHDMFCLYSSAPKMRLKMELNGYLIMIFGLKAPDLPVYGSFAPRRPEADLRWAKAIVAFFSSYDHTVLAGLKMIKDCPLLASAWAGHFIPVSSHLQPHMPSESFRDFQYELPSGVSQQDLRYLTEYFQSNDTSLPGYDARIASIAHAAMQHLLRLAYLGVCLCPFIAAASVHPSMTVHLIKLNFSITVKALDIVSAFLCTSICENYFYRAQVEMESKHILTSKYLAKEVDPNAKVETVMDSMGQVVKKGFRKPNSHSWLLSSMPIVIDTMAFLHYMNLLEANRIFRAFLMKRCETVMRTLTPKGVPGIRIGFIVVGSVWDCPRMTTAWKTMESIGFFKKDNPGYGLSEEEISRLKRRLADLFDSKNVEKGFLSAGLEPPSLKTQVASSSPVDTQIARSTKHCEILLFISALLSYLAEQGVKELTKDTPEVKDFVEKWEFGGSRLCCPVCAEFFQAWNILVPGAHNRLFAVSLPANIPSFIFDHLLTRFSQLLMVAVENLLHGRRQPAPSETMASGRYA
ncbi:hypothetical protein C8J56DRAFT_1045144 [Mycena floridula]|nr:hypothetical protein C8J56DRAFT_1045144 [Mycena floridula]